MQPRRQISARPETTPMATKNGGGAETEATTMSVEFRRIAGTPDIHTRAHAVFIYTEESNSKMSGVVL
jgi:hypothetical protein